MVVKILVDPRCSGSPEASFKTPKASPDEKMQLAPLPKSQVPGFRGGGSDPKKNRRKNQNSGISWYVRNVFGCISWFLSFPIPQPPATACNH